MTTPIVEGEPGPDVTKYLYERLKAWVHKRLRKSPARFDRTELTHESRTHHQRWDSELNRIHTGYVIGVGLLALGFFFGFFALGPCDAQNCLLWPSNVLVDLTVGFSLSWGLVILGIGILTASLLMGRRTKTTKGGTHNEPPRKRNTTEPKFEKD
jgi:hypothetical protein